MSKTPRSSSRTYSRSASRSRSASDSRSRSRSSSQSRSRKHRYGSRSRSRSHSPFHNRGRKQPREYQNQREFRGYHRGFRRPYYFRGRGRGFFRGRFQRGGGGGGGGGYNNYRANNWQNFGQYPQQKQQKQQKQQQVHQPQKQHLHSPKRGRSHTPKKRSSSPQSLSHSHRSDRSSSQHSHHSSSSSSSQQINSSVKQNSKAGIEVLFSSKESQKAGRGDATLPVQDGHHPEVDGSTSQTKPNKTCLFPITHDSSPKRANPHIHSVVRAVQDDPASRDSVSVAGKSGATSNGATYSQPIASTLSTSSPQKKSPTTVFSGFGLFSNADQEEDTVAISIAFKKFLEEQKSKKQALADKTMENMADNGNPFPENRNNKCEGACDRSSVSRLPRPAEPQNKIEDERYKYVDHFKGNTSSSSFRPTVMSEDGEEKDSEHSEPHLENEVSNIKSKIALSARELFEEHLKRLDDRTWDDELEAFLITREKERAASIVSALSKREKFARKFEDLSPERPSKVKRKDTMTLSPSPTYKPISRRSSEIQEQEMLMNVGDESLPRASAKRERDFNLRMDSLSEDLARSSVLSNDWRNTVDHVHCDKKALQYRWCNNLCRSPKELFAQHVISIVHYITEQHFSSSGMTLSDRFTMYQRKAAEKEIMRQRKSPEIHRRIDVSPSAFKRHSFLFDELKGSGDSSSKIEVKQFKEETLDLPMNVEQSKKYLIRESNEKHEEQSGSPESNMDSSAEKSSKQHKIYKKSKKKRERSCSSSSSSFVHEEETESTKKCSTQLQVREHVGATETGQTHRGLQFQIRGRGWNRGNCAGTENKSNNSAHVPGLANNLDWDSEQMDKSQKYYMLGKKDVDSERKWVDAQGHDQSAIPRVKGRFILRRPTISITTNNSNWTHDKFKASGDDGEPGKRDHKDQNSA